LFSTVSFATNYKFTHDVGIYLWPTKERGIRRIMTLDYFEEEELLGLRAPTTTPTSATNVADATPQVVERENTNPLGVNSNTTESMVGQPDFATANVETEESKWQGFIDSVRELYHPGENPGVCVAFNDITDKELGMIFDLLLCTDKVGLLARDYEFAAKIREACRRQASFDRSWSRIEVVFPFDIMDWEVFNEWK
jgi:hypothetical protein